MKKTLFAILIFFALSTQAQMLPNNPFLGSLKEKEPIPIPDSIVVTKKKILLVSDPALAGDSTFMAISTDKAQFVFTGKKGIVTNVSHFKLTKVQGAPDIYVLFSEKKVFTPYANLSPQAKGLFNVVEGAVLNGMNDEANGRKLYNTPVNGWKKQKSR